MSARSLQRPGPQTWYVGSAVNEETMANGIVLARVREAGIAGVNRDLAYFEWSAEDDADPEDWDARAAANPGMGFRIAPDYIEREFQSPAMSLQEFLVERLGVGNWPDTSLDGKVIDPVKWRACLDVSSVPLDPVCLAFDVSPDRAFACVAAAGWRSDGRPHVEVVRQGRGTNWVGEALQTVVEKHRPVAIICDNRASGALVAKMVENNGLRTHDGKGQPRGAIVTVTATEHAHGCGIFFDAVEQGQLRHLGDPKLDAAAAGAVKRKSNDAWLWDKLLSTVDITPLVASTLALQGLHEFRRRPAQIVTAQDLLGDDEADEIVESGLPPLSPEDL
jgi:hypothetical protein